MEQAGTLVSVQVGQPVRMEFQGKVWESAIDKRPVVGRVWLDATNLEGDRQPRFGTSAGIQCVHVE